MRGIVYPDLLIAFDANPQPLKESNAYIVSEQGKAPDFIPEVASDKTRTLGRTTKRDDYTALGVAEYWRYDEKRTGATPGWPETG